MTTVATTTAVSSYAPSLSNNNGQITTTSIQVADHFGKRHADVLRAISKLDCSKDFIERNFAFIQKATDLGNGRTRQDRACSITKDGFMFLAMGFTGKEAAQWKEAYITAFNKMEAQICAPALPSPYITTAQAQHLSELVDLVVESGRQKTHAETWARFHRKMKVNKYSLLHPSQFDDAVAYLRGKMDDTSIATIAQKHFPQLALPAPEAPSLKNRRWLISFNPVDGHEEITPVPMDAGVMSPTNISDIHAFVNEMVPLCLLPKVADTAIQRIARNFSALRPAIANEVMA